MIEANDGLMLRMDRVDSIQRIREDDDLFKEGFRTYLRLQDGTKWWVATPYDKLRDSIRPWPLWRDAQEASITLDRRERALIADVLNEAGYVKGQVLDALRDGPITREWDGDDLEALAAKLESVLPGEDPS